MSFCSLTREGCVSGYNLFSPARCCSPQPSRRGPLPRTAPGSAHEHRSCERAEAQTLALLRPPRLDRGRCISCWRLHGGRGGLALDHLRVREPEVRHVVGDLLAVLVIHLLEDAGVACGRTKPFTITCADAFQTSFVKALLSASLPMLVQTANRLSACSCVSPCSWSTPSLRSLHTSRIMGRSLDYYKMPSASRIFSSISVVN